MIECAAAPGNRRKGIPARTREEESPFPPRVLPTLLTDGERRGALNRAVDVWGVARVRMGKRITIAEEQDAFTERNADESALVSSMVSDQSIGYRLLHAADI